MRIGSLFSGYGGLDLAVTDVLGGDVAWHAENDPAASRVLAYRWPGVPNLGDVTVVDWTAVEPVDVLAGSTPCQDVSHAGARRGMRVGTRSGLWAAMVDAVEALRPELVAWENVQGVLSAGADSDMEPCPGCVGDGPGQPVLLALGRVLGDLADLGYDAGWAGVRARDVGAPHERFRVFVVARDTVRSDSNERTAAGLARQSGPAARPAAAAADADRQRHGGRQDSPDVGRVDGPHAGEAPQRQRARQELGDRGPAAGGVAWGDIEPAIRRWERLTRLAPLPVEAGTRGQPRLAARFVEWMMGLPDGWVTDVPGVVRNAQMRILSNGVVPQQAASGIWAALELLDRDLKGAA